MHDVCEKQRAITVPCMYPTNRQQQISCKLVHKFIRYKDISSIRGSAVVGGDSNYSSLPVILLGRL